MIENQINDVTYLLENDELWKFNRYNKYFKVYPFATENIDGYFKQLDIKGKDVLTVCSSGDHVFNAILHGAKKVSCFDINAYTYYYMLLKKAIIEAYDYDKFIHCFRSFDIGKWWNYGEFQDLYENIYHKIDEKASKFWELVYNNLIESNNRFEDKLFYNFFDWSIELSDRNFFISNTYFDRRQYDALKERICDYDIAFTRCNLKELPIIINEKFDLIFLSNISYYLENMYEDNYLANYRSFVINELSRLLKNNGKAAFAYIPNLNDEGYYMPESNSINSKQKRNQYFGDISETVSFQGLFNEESGILLYKKAA